MTRGVCWIAILGLAGLLIGCGGESGAQTASPESAAPKPAPRAETGDKSAMSQHAEPTAEGDEADKPQATVGEWLEGDDRIDFDLDFKMTNQDGETVNLADFEGKPIAVTFFFTRCSNPQMCPLIVLTMARLQRDLEQAGINDDVHTMLITYDPTYDTPERIKKYGADRGFRFDNGVMLRPDPDQYIDLLHELSISIQPTTDGSINHVRELMIIDAQGRYVRDYHGEIWDNEMVLEDLRRLVEETRTNGE